jgi:adenylate cyclase
MARLQILAVTAAFVFVGVLGLRGGGLLDAAELAVYDRHLRAQAGQTAPSPIVLVEIRESDIHALGHWPISDRILADALTRLVEADARVIGLDLFRDLPVAPGVRALEHVLSREGRIIAVDSFGDARGRISGPPILAGSDRVGFNDLPLDADGRIRRALLFQDDGARPPELSFALRVALAALARDGVGLTTDPDRPDRPRIGVTTLRPFEADDGGYTRGDAGGFQLLLDFAAGSEAFERIGFLELAVGEVPASRLRDRVVLIGSSASSLRDDFSVPVSTVPLAGVALHAHAVDQLIRHAEGRSAPLRPLPEAAEIALLLFVSALGCAIGFGIPGRTPLLGASAQILATAVGVGGLWVTASVAFRAGYWLPVVAPSLAWIGAAGVATMWVSSRERAQRSQLMRIFALHMSPEVADEIWRRRDEVIRDGRVQPRRLPCTVLFVDMRGYTQQAERMPPEQLMEWSNAFLTRMVATLHAHGGVIDDYFGDGVKANFGVPIPRRDDAEVAADAREAVACALDMSRALEQLNGEYERRGLPTCAAKIGIHTGQAVAGSAGSPDRLKYTVVGDVVITAQRLEDTHDVDHDYATLPIRILISGHTRELVGDAFSTEAVGPIALRGLREPVPVHRVLGPAGV